MLSLYAVKVLDAYGSGYISDVIEGIDWAVQNNMDIISMSLGTATYSQALNDTAANAYKAGIILVAAAGNSGDGNLSTDDVLYPAKFDSVIAVSAIDYNNIAPVWSADGSQNRTGSAGCEYLFHMDKWRLCECKRHIDGSAVCQRCCSSGQEQEFIHDSTGNS